MSIAELILLAEGLALLAFGVLAVYKNTGNYTVGLPWPLEPIAAYLNNRARQPWRPAYFNSIIEHAVLPAVYTAVFKMIDGRLHILLTPRSDEYWKDVAPHPHWKCTTSSN